MAATQEDLRLNSTNTGERPVRATILFPGTQHNITDHQRTFIGPFLDHYNPGDISIKQLLQKTEARAEFAKTPKGKILEQDEFVLIPSGEQDVLLRFKRAEFSGNPRNLIPNGSQKYSVTGADHWWGNILSGREVQGVSFTRVDHAGKVVRLFDENGRSKLPRDIIDELKPFEPGSVFNFHNGKYDGETLVLSYKPGTAPADYGLLAPKERPNIAEDMDVARALGKRIAITYKQGQEGILDALFIGRPGVRLIQMRSNKSWVELVDGEDPRDGDRSLPTVEEGILDIILLPEGGNLEESVRSGMAKIRSDDFEIPDTYAIWTVDVNQTGTAAAKQELIPVDTEKERSIDATYAEKVFGWQKTDQVAFQGYKADHSILPVHLYGATVTLNENPAGEIYKANGHMNGSKVA